MSIFLEKYGLFSIACIVAFAFLAVDIILPLGVAGGVFYIGAILLGRWFPSSSLVLAIILISVVLTIVGFFYSPEGGELWKVLFNRGLALFAILSTGFVIYYEKKAIENTAAQAEQSDENNRASYITAPELKHIAQKQIYITGYKAAIVGFPILMVIISITFWINYKSEEALKMVSHSHEVNSALSHLLSTLQDAETGQRGFLLTGEEDYLEPFIKANLQLDKVLNHWRSLPHDHAQPPAHKAQVVQLIDKKMAELHETISLMKEQGLTSALKLVRTDEGKAIMDDLRIIIKKMETEEERLLIKETRLYERNKILALSAELIGFVLIILISVFVTFRVRSLLALQAETEEQLRHMANHDPLTGLATRILGMEYISMALAKASRNNSRAAVLFVDLDGFKTVNDTLGHNAGDSVLKSVSERLLLNVRQVDQVVRFGGDEFFIVMSDIINHENVSEIAQKLIDVLAQPFTVGDQSISIGASIGIALYPDHAQGAEALLICADDAMYEIKKKGKNYFAFVSAC